MTEVQTVGLLVLPRPAFNAMVRNGEFKALIVFDRDHIESGSVASPNSETEAMATQTEMWLAPSTLPSPSTH